MKMVDAAKMAMCFNRNRNKDVITGKHMKLMKDGAILGNSGHFNVEINQKDLQKLAKSHRTVRDQVEEYTMPNGRNLF